MGLSHRPRPAAFGAIALDVRAEPEDGPDHLEWDGTEPLLGPARRTGKREKNPVQTLLPRQPFCVTDPGCQHPLPPPLSSVAAPLGALRAGMRRILQLREGLTTSLQLNVPPLTLASRVGDSLLLVRGSRPSGARTQPGSGTPALSDADHYSNAPPLQAWSTWPGEPSVKPKPAPQSSRRPPQLDFTDHKLVFCDTPTSELLRAYCVFALCGLPGFVHNSERLLGLSNVILGRWLTRKLNKATFFGHFCAGAGPPPHMCLITSDLRAARGPPTHVHKPSYAHAHTGTQIHCPPSAPRIHTQAHRPTPPSGENEAEVAQTMDLLKRRGVGGILDYAAEGDTPAGGRAGGGLSVCWGGAEHFILILYVYYIW